MIVGIGTYEHAIFTLVIVSNKEGKRFRVISGYSPHISAVTSMCCCGKTGLLVSGSSDETMRVYDLSRRVESGRIDHHSATVSGLAITADGAHVLSCADGESDSSICIWRTSDWEPLRSIPSAHSRGVTSLALHPSGRVAVSLGRDGKLKMWDLTKAKLVCSSAAPSMASSLAWDSAGAFFVVGAASSVVVHHMGSTSKTIEMSYSVTSVTSVGAGLIAAGCVNGIVVVWNVAEEKCIVTLDGHKARVKAMCWIGNKTELFECGCCVDVDVDACAGVLVTTSTDGLVSLWNCSNWKLITSKDLHSRINCVTCSVVNGDLPEEPIDDDDDDEEIQK